VVDNQVLGHGQRRTDGGIDEARRRFAELESRTRSALAGAPTDDPLYHGVAEAVARHAIPPALPLELLEGLASDVEGESYRTLEETRRYADLVAGSVAAMMGYLMDARAPESIAGFRLLGTAVQFTNISRDVVDDAAAGRFYLPLEWLDQAGIPAAEVAAPRHRERLAGVVARFLAVADEWYRSGLAAVGGLGLRNRWVVRTGTLIYRDIGRVIRRRGARAWDRRAVVSGPRRVALLLAALAGSGL
jgi:phytoene synthase